MYVIIDLVHSDNVFLLDQITHLSDHCDGYHDWFFIQLYNCTECSTGWSMVKWICLYQSRTYSHRVTSYSIPWDPWWNLYLIWSFLFRQSSHFLPCCHLHIIPTSASSPSHCLIATGLKTVSCVSRVMYLVTSFAFVLDLTGDIGSLVLVSCLFDFTSWSLS